MAYTEEQIRNMSYDEKMNLAESTSTLEVLVKLSKDRWWGVRWRVAENTNATDQVLVSVFEYERSRKEQEEDVLYAIVEHANCPDYLKAVIQTKLEGK
jgi:hypothetical protein